MGLFDFFFNRSKQEQDKPIRDKLKTRKNFTSIPQHYSLRSTFIY